MTEPVPEITGVTVTPSSVDVVAGQTTGVSAEVSTANGVQGITVDWSSSDASVATVEASGEGTATVTGVSTGSAEITATATATNVDGSTSGTAAVQVREPEPATVEGVTIESADGEPLEGPASGELQITIDVDPGDEEATTVSLVVDGEVVSTQEIAGASGSGAAGAAARQQAVEDVVFNFRTDRLEGSSPGNVITADNVTLDGNVKRGQFENGEHTISAQISGSPGQPVRSTSDPQTVGFDNDNLVIADHLSGGGGVVEPTSGSRYWGGEDIQMSVTPVIFDGGLTAGSITISASAGRQTGGGGGSVTFDSPTTSGEPFVFDILQSDNAGQVEDASGEPDGPGGFGSDFGIGDIRDGSGAVVVEEFTLIGMNDFFLDFVSPEAGSDAAITVDGAEIAEQTYYTAGALSVRDVSDGGSGLGEDPFILDVIPENADPPIETDFLDDLPEGPAGQFQPRVREWGDAVGNPGDPSAIPDPPPIGIDQLGPMIEPPSTQNGEPPLVTDGAIPTTINDPPLDFPDSPPGSGVNTENCAENCAHIHADVLLGPPDGPSGFIVRRSGPGLSGTYSGTISVFSDPAGHDPFIFNAGSGEPISLDLTVNDGNLDMQGSPPFVDVTGTRMDDGTAQAEGSGTVAGYSNTRVVFDGDLTTEGGLSGTYEMGANGGLPGGQSIFYSIEATQGGGSQTAQSSSGFEIVIPADAPDGTYTVEVEARDQALPDGNAGVVEFEFELHRSGSN